MSETKISSPSRRTMLKLAAAATAAPYVWIPKPGIAQTSARGKIKHLLYVRLSGGFRFTTAFNGDVSEELNPFGRAGGRAPGTEWGMTSPFGRAAHLNGDAGTALKMLGMKTMPEIGNQISVMPCVDHEPMAGSADGNHATALERYYTGYVDGPVGFFTMINYGLRNRKPTDGKPVLPSFILGGAGMGRGLGMYAAYRPPVLSGDGFDRFSAKTAAMPAWAQAMVDKRDTSFSGRLHTALRTPIDTYRETRRATEQYTKIFEDPILKIGNNSNDPVDGLSNRQLVQIFGDDGTSRNVRLALRLFHFGAPAIYFDQGGYDMHSGEEMGLPPQLENVGRMMTGLELALKKMTHPSGGTYWDHTVVVLGSEFSRTTRGGKFNSARGSDHGGDLATRWLSMPFMGGPIARPGRRIGETRANDLKAMGKVYSYRSLLKTLMDGLGCEHEAFFPADMPFEDLYV